MQVLVCAMTCLIDKQTEYELIIPDFLVPEPKKFILVEIPFCIRNEGTAKRFLDKLQSSVHHKNLMLQLNVPLRKLKVCSV